MTINRNPFNGIPWTLGPVIVLLLALVNGVFYVFLVPPWQHYDEPNHFEYAWLVANREDWPVIGDYDQSMRRQVSESMLRNGFFAAKETEPEVTSGKEPIWFGGYEQLSEPPVYYWLAAQPLKMFDSASIENQLYAARLVSLLLFLLSVGMAYGVIREITSEKNPARFVFPLIIGLTPAFVDLMTAVNNDVGAVAAFSLFVFGGVRLLKRGINPIDLILLILSAGLCFYTKRTAWLALPLALPVILVSVFPERLRKYAWISILVLGIVASGLVLTWKGAAWWYLGTTTNSGGRVLYPEAPVGKAVFSLPASTSRSSDHVVQVLPVVEGEKLINQTVTVGAWMWADEPVMASLPRLHIVQSGDIFSKEVLVSTTPHFSSFSVILNAPDGRIWLELAYHPDDQYAPAGVYYDGVILAEGIFPEGEIPQFDDDSARSGTWGSVQFTNIIRNGSAEEAWVGIRPEFDRLGSKIFPDYGQDSLSFSLYTLLDLPASGWYYRATIKNLLQTFWARFGWGHVAVGGYIYRILYAITAVGIFGGVAGAIIYIKKLNWAVVFFLAACLAGVWGLTFIRGSNYLLIYPFFPSSRYAFPAIIPTMLWLFGGWLSFLLVLPRPKWFPTWIFYLLIGITFLFLNALSLFRIYEYYQM